MYEITHDGCWVPLFIHFVIWLVVILAVTAIPTLLLDFLLGFLAAVVDTYVSSWGQNLHNENKQSQVKILQDFWLNSHFSLSLCIFYKNYKNIVIVALHHIVASNYTKFWSNLINQARFIHKSQADYEFHTSSSEYVQFFLRKVRAVLSLQDLAAATWDSTCGSWSSRTGIGRPLLTKLSRASRYG